GVGVGAGFVGVGFSPALPGPFPPLAVDEQPFGGAARLVLRALVLLVLAAGIVGRRLLVGSLAGPSEALREVGDALRDRLGRVHGVLHDTRHGLGLPLRRLREG